MAHRMRVTSSLMHGTWDGYGEGNPPEYSRLRARSPSPNRHDHVPWRVTWLSPSVESTAARKPMCPTCRGPTHRGQEVDLSFLTELSLGARHSDHAGTGKGRARKRKQTRRA